MYKYKPEGFNYAGKAYSKEDILKAKEENGVLEGIVTKSDADLNLYIKISRTIDGIIKFADLEFSPYGEPIKPIAAITKVGKCVNFKVLEVEEDEEGHINVTLSRKLAMQDCYENYVKQLKIGEIIDAKITHTESYGAFCDIGCGLTYLLPIENLCITRIETGKEALQGKTFIKAVIIAKNKAGKVVLSHKELLGTWEHEVSKFAVGETVMGTVRSIKPYGIFVELTPNLSGLAELTPGVKLDNRVSVYIKSISAEKMKVKLVIIGFDAETVKTEPSLKFDYVQTSGRLKQWIYSPIESSRIISTDFEGMPETIDWHAKVK